LVLSLNEAVFSGHPTKSDKCSSKGGPGTRLNARSMRAGAEGKYTKRSGSSCGQAAF